MSIKVYRYCVMLFSLTGNFTIVIYSLFFLYAKISRDMSL
jgi:hypothetical protein